MTSHNPLVLPHGVFVPLALWERMADCYYGNGPRSTPRPEPTPVAPLPSQPISPLQDPGELTLKTPVPPGYRPAGIHLRKPPPPSNNAPSPPSP